MTHSNENKPWCLHICLKSLITPYWPLLEIVKYSHEIHTNVETCLTHNTLQIQSTPVYEARCILCDSPFVNFTVYTENDISNLVYSLVVKLIK